MFQVAFYFPIAFLWATIGALIWIVGFAGHRLPKPTTETLSALKAQGVKAYLVIPRWARVFCGFAPSMAEPLAREAVFMQLVGWHAVVWGIIAGFAIYLPCSPLVVVAGILGPIYSAGLLMRTWQARQDE